MSVEAMAWALGQESVADPTARHVLLCLANYADQDGRAAFPSVERLRRNTGLSERTIRYKLDLLESLGVITRGRAAIAAAYIGRPDRLPTCYDICIYPLERGFRGASNAPRSQTGCNLQDHGVQVATKRGASNAPKPSPEPSTEPSPPGLTKRPIVQNARSDESGGNDLHLGMLPETLRSEVCQLVSGLDQAQCYVDLLVARLRRDKNLPVTNKLQAPILWLRKVIAGASPDFSAAKGVNKMREADAEAARRTQDGTTRRLASEERKAVEILEAKQLLDALSEEELAELAEEAALEVPSILGSQKRNEVRALVMSRSLGTNLAKVAILKTAQSHASRTKLQ